ncbi:MAG: 30S ribosomal protein S7 [Candidatus Nanohaloarchaeota archaeon QJJ-7]|nr:30S ribosomal protein S7 [Candidatus Nanohaloarchaeota archaeon QJJ-7]
MSEIKIFDEWDSEEAEVHDEGLKRYINTENIMAPRSKGRHSDQQFYRGDVQIVERFLNRMYVAGHKGKKHQVTSGHNVGKSEKLWNVLKETFEIIEEETGENPVQVLVTAVENSSPTEEVVSYQRGGVMARKAVTVSPQRRVDLAVRMLVQGAYEGRLAESEDATDAIASEIIGAYENDSSVRAVREKERREKEAEGAR